MIGIDFLRCLAGASPANPKPWHQKVSLTPNWISRFGNADVKPSGVLGENALLPCTLNVVLPVGQVPATGHTTVPGGVIPNSGPTSLFTLA